MRPAAVPSICKRSSSVCPSQFHLLLHISSTRNGRVFITSLPQEVIRCQYPQIIIPVINFFSHSRFGIKVPTESKFYEFFLPGLSFSESRWVAQLGGRVVSSNSISIFWSKRHAARHSCSHNFPFRGFSVPHLCRSFVLLGTQFLFRAQFTAHDILQHISHPRVFLAECNQFDSPCNYPHPTITITPRSFQFPLLRLTCQDSGLREKARSPVVVLRIHDEHLVALLCCSSRWWSTANRGASLSVVRVLLLWVRVQSALDRLLVLSINCVGKWCDGCWCSRTKKWKTFVNSPPLLALQFT